MIWLRTSHCDTMKGSQLPLSEFFQIKDAEFIGGVYEDYAQ